MNDDSMELEDRVRELVLGGEAGRRELNDLLRANEAARPIAARLLVEDAALISALRIDTVAKWADNLPPRTIDEITGNRHASRPRRAMAITLATAACVAVSAVIFVRSRQAPGSSTAPVAKTGETIGLITRLDGQGQDPPASTLLEKGAFELSSGRARIDLDNGVVLSITGPARLAIGLNHCRLWKGQVGVDVPEDLDTYVVETDDGRFVDLGTAFSVSVQPGKRTDMAVQEGLVRAEQISYEGDILSTQLVKESEGVVLDKSARQIRTVPAGGLGHEVPIPHSNAALIVPQAYRNAVLASAPLIAWDFESQLDDATFPNRAGSSFPAKVHGRIRPSDNHGGNRFLVLGESEEGGWIESAEPWRKDDATPFTIELWARPDRIHWGHLVNLRVDDPIDRVTGHAPIGPLSYFSLEITHTREFQPLPPEPSVRTTFRSPATEHPTLSTPGGVNANLVSPQRYLPGKWHHLVARVDRHEFALFIDGKPVSRHAITVPHFGDVDLGLRVGALRPQKGIHRQFVGALDEVAIYGRALSDDEVANHFRTMGGEP